MAINSPEGTRDLLPDEAKFWAHFRDTAFGIFARYGYQPIETPLFEQTDLFVRGIGQATDVVSKEMFTAISGENFKRVMEGGAIKAKKPPEPAPRGAPRAWSAPWCSMTWCRRARLRPSSCTPARCFAPSARRRGRQRMFNQVGIECLGAEDPSVDAEGIIMLMRFYAAIGVPMDATRLLVNSMGCEQCRPKYREAVREYMNAHAEHMCEECMRRAEINPLRAFDCKNPGCAEVMEGARRSRITCAMTAAKALPGRQNLSGRRGHLLHRGPHAGPRSRLLHAHRVRGAGRSGHGQPKTPSAAAVATTSWPRKWAVAHAGLRLRAGLRALRAGHPGSGSGVPERPALRHLRGVRGRFRARRGVPAWCRHAAMRA